MSILPQPLSLFDGQTCSRCLQWRPFLHFKLKSLRLGGHTTVCYPCRQGRQNISDAYLASVNPAALAERKEREKAIERDRQARKRKEHPEQIRQALREWYAKKGVEYHATWRHVNHDRVIALKRARYAADPQVSKTYILERKNRKKSSGGSHTREQWRDLQAKFGHRCLCCSSPGPLTQDHIVPLSRGGSDDISNTQLLCLSCNCRKGTKHINYRWDRLLPPP